MNTGVDQMLEFSAFFANGAGQFHRGLDDLRSPGFSPAGDFHSNGFNWLIVLAVTAVSGACYPFFDMMRLLDHPLVFFIFTFIGLWASTWMGVAARKKILTQEDSHDLDFVIGAILTLLGLLIGFSFSMATSRYDQRKNYEEEEANAIGTEYVRVEFLPQEEAAKLQGLLKKYLDLRIAYYDAPRNQRRIDELDAETAQMQDQMWAEVRAAAAANPTPVAAVVVTGMNDVLNRQGYTQAAWWNRLPVAAWGLMGAISVVCSALVGFAARFPRGILFLILPLAVSISFLLIADIDSPRGGLIRVRPQNLIGLQKSMHG